MNKRDQGLDLLRVLSMYMVVVLHILSRGGGLLSNLTSGSIAWNLAWFLEIACYCAVNCFVLITGYLMIERSVKISSIIVLWLQVLFYSAGISLVFLLVDSKSVTMVECIKSFFPVIGQQYWYFTAYFVLFFLLPFMNMLLRQLNKRHYAILIVVLVGFFSVLNTFSLADCFRIGSGYSVFWLMIVYAIGGYIKRFLVLVQKPYRFIVGYLLAVSFTWTIKSFAIIIPFFGWQGTVINRAMAVMSSALISYSSPTILLAAVCLFCFFIGKKVKCSKLIFKISSMSFSVYLIHTHPLIFNTVFSDAFSFICELSWMLQTAVVLLVAVGIFSICLVIETIRRYFFQLCRIKDIARMIDRKVSEYGFFEVYGDYTKEKE